MANQPQPQSGGASQTKLWLVIMTLIMVIVAGAAVVGSYVFLNGGDAANAVPAHDESNASHDPAPVEPPVFVTVAPFTANLQDPQGRILYIKMALKVAGEDEAERVEAVMPEIRNRILMILTDQSADRLTTAEGKKALAEQLTSALSEPFGQPNRTLGIRDVLFTDLIVQ